MEILSSTLNHIAVLFSFILIGFVLKKKNILYFRNIFEDDSIDVDELEMKSCDVDNNGKISFTPNEDFE